MSKKIIAACDCETDPFGFDIDGKPILDIQPFIWGYYNGKKYKKFDSTEEFIKDVRNRPWNFYAHNGGKFDYMFLLPFLDEAQDIKIINGRISRFTIGRATFFDSYNILPVALKELEKDDFDYSKLKKDVREQHREEIETYLENDCRYLHKYILELFSKRKSKLTLASSAMAEFEAVVEKMPTSDSVYQDKFKQFYYGGRVSHFELGVIKAEKNQKIEIFDINSAYPTAMRYQHPYGTKMGTEIVELSKLPVNREEIENCFIELECFSNGCLPHRASKNSGIEFPVEKRVWKITGWEYLAGIDTNSISDIKILRVYHFLECRDFSPYVDKFYAEKLQAEKEKDKSGRLIAKLYLNSCYGKFAQDERKYKNYKFCTAEKAFDFILCGSIDGAVLNDEYIADHVIDPNMIERWDLTREFSNGMTLIESPVNKSYWEETEDGTEKGDTHECYNIATAASITGWVRAFMWRSLCQVERPLYCDTDSIACFNGDKLPLGDDLGQWDCEMTNISEMAIAGKKLYAAFSPTGTKVACKGVQLSAEEIKEVALGNEVEYKKMSPIFSIRKEPSALNRFVNRQDRKEINTAKRKLKLARESKN